MNPSAGPSAVPDAPPRPSRAARTTPPRPDPAAAQAVELARRAAAEEGGSDVGAHLGVVADGERVVTHTFEATLAGYVGWHWAVTLTRASRSKTVTVDEVVLLPGSSALRPPAWVPWSQRLQAGDLSPGDLLPADEDDDRLVPAYIGLSIGSAADPDAAGEARQLAEELGLGRVRVLSREGRLDAADRWNVITGADTDMARQAPGPCGTCGFLVSVAGSLQASFGVCANEYSPADARVVSVEYGCGAHSEASAVVDGPATRGSVYESDAMDLEVNDAVVIGGVPAVEFDAVEPEAVRDDAVQDDTVRADVPTADTD